MNYENIVSEVQSGSKSLIMVSKGFMEKPFGFYLRDTNGNLTKVHGISARKAESALMNLTTDSGTSIGRSYSKGELNFSNGKTKKVFIRQLELITGL